MRSASFSTDIQIFRYLFLLLTSCLFSVRLLEQTGEVVNWPLGHFMTILYRGEMMKAAAIWKEKKITRTKGHRNLDLSLSTLSLICATVHCVLLNKRYDVSLAGFLIAMYLHTITRLHACIFYVATVWYLRLSTGAFLSSVVTFRIFPVPLLVFSSSSCLLFLFSVSVFFSFFLVVSSSSVFLKSASCPFYPALYSISTPPPRHLHACIHTP
jgi:hypothetical protein